MLFPCEAFPVYDETEHFKWSTTISFTVGQKNTSFLKLETVSATGWSVLKNKRYLIFYLKLQKKLEDHISYLDF